MGGTVDQVLTLALKYHLIPVARSVFGTVDGHIIMGQQASGNVPFAYASAGGKLQSQMMWYAIPLQIWGNVLPE